MNKIYADYKRIFMDNWNGAIGNKILHTYFLIHLCKKHNRQPVIYKGSNLDNLFDFNFEVSDNKPPINKYYYQEPDIFYIQNKLLSFFKQQYFLKDRFSSLEKIVDKSYSSYINRMSFFNELDLPEKALMISGHFWEYELMPDKKTVAEYMAVKPDIVSNINKKYPTISYDDNVSVHFRGTDYHKHLNYVFKEGIVLDKEYYLKSIRYLENKLGNNLTYHLFSDDLSFLQEVFAGKNVVIHRDSAYDDWVALSMSKNVIQSNSSFCWTACLHNKGISIQPKDGFNYYKSNGSIPYGFQIGNAILID